MRDMSVGEDILAGRTDIHLLAQRQSRVRRCRAGMGYCVASDVWIWHLRGCRYDGITCGVLCPFVCW